MLLAAQSISDHLTSTHIRRQNLLFFGGGQFSITAGSLLGRETRRVSPACPPPPVHIAVRNDIIDGA